MELTDLEKEAQGYAARCFEGRHMLMQQLAINFAERLVNLDRPWDPLSLSEIPKKSVLLAAEVLDELDRYTDENAERLRAYYLHRHKTISINWDSSKFSSETWLKQALSPEQGPRPQF